MNCIQKICVKCQTFVFPNVWNTRKDNINRHKLLLFPTSFICWWHFYPVVHLCVDILQWLTYYWTLLPRLLLVALCLLCMLIVIPASELPPDYRWFPADNWTVNEIWWTDGASPWGQLPCPLWPRDMGVEVGPDTLLLRHTQKFHPFYKFIVMLQKRATVSAWHVIE